MSLPVQPGALLVVSPHLDDAVFSCAELIAAHAGTRVVTVFAGAPSGFDRLTPWDAASGFASAQQAIACRREEDRAALALLEAIPLWLDFCDRQYDSPPPPAALADKLADIVSGQSAQTILVPAGLFHSDHALVHQAALQLRARHPDRIWLMYEEARYRRVSSLLQRRLAQLAGDGVAATPLAIGDSGAGERKRAAVHCYASQLRAFAASGNEYDDLFAAERYWRLEPLPPGLAGGAADA